MPRRAATVTQADVARAIRAAKQEGMHPVRIVLTGTGASIEIRDTPDIHSGSETETKLEPLEVI
jgi:hypothetical protein